jgi:hypothetical protein
MALSSEYNKARNAQPTIRLTLNEYYELVHGFASMATVLETDPIDYDLILSRLD